MRYLTLYGTRPEAIKLSPVIRLMRKKKMDVVEVFTAQHSDMLSGALPALFLSPGYNLAARRKGQSLAELKATLSDLLPSVFEKALPDAVIVHGDTVTALAGAETAFLMKLPVIHIEAGLRSHDLFAPFPEEYCRRAIALMASYHFAPTEAAKDNLLREGIPEQRITVTGNTGIDALFSAVRKNFSHPLLEKAKGKRLFLLTLHRRENWGEPMEEALTAVKDALSERDGILILYPVHKNPAIRALVGQVFHDSPNILLTEPLEAEIFQNLLARAEGVITDSGGIQEEAVALGKNALVLREKTERSEGVLSGHLTLIPCRYTPVKIALTALFDRPNRVPSAPSFLYGNGSAAQSIVSLLQDENFQKFLK